MVNKLSTDWLWSYSPSHSWNKSTVLISWSLISTLTEHYRLSTVIICNIPNVNRIRYHIKPSFLLNKWGLSVFTKEMKASYSGQKDVIRYREYFTTQMLQNKAFGGFKNTVCSCQGIRHHVLKIGRCWCTVQVKLIANHCFIALARRVGASSCYIYNSHFIYCVETRKTYHWAPPYNTSWLWYY